MILHLIDDEKIAPRTIELFEEALPGQNLFVCFRMQTQRVTLSERVMYDDQVGNLDNNRFNMVIIHYLSERKRVFYEKYIHRKIKTYWIVWGGDIYNNLLTSRGFDTYYEPTYGGGKMLIKNKLAKIGIKLFYKKELVFIKEHISYLLTFNEEYDLFKRYLGNYLPPKAEMYFFYYPIDKIVGPFLINSWCNVESKNIVVGNCATVSNNHCLVFRFLKKCNLVGAKIIPVLSYGGTPKYICHVNSIGKKLFGEKYQPQSVFLPIEKYNAFMREAAYFVYGNWRQEAVGNIVVAFYLGAKVFLSIKSPLLSFFKNKGLYVFVLEQMNEHSLTPLSEIERQHNRNIMKHNYNEALLLERIRKTWSY